MNLICKLAPLLMAGLLNACVALPEPRQTAADINGRVLIERIQNVLPGAYSNFAQTYQNHSSDPVTDINIRQLKTVGEPVFLFESEQRGLDTSIYDIYWLKLNPQTQQAEFHFARLRKDELSLPTQTVVAKVWQRVQPGCVVVLSDAEDRLAGQTNPDTCMFEHPLRGESRLIHSLLIGNDTLNIKTEYSYADTQPSTDIHLLELQKHRIFEGWAGTRPETVQGQDRPGEWQLSSVFSLRDDGRLTSLRNRQTTSMGFGLRLSKLPWIEGKPPYMLLAVINLESGAIQAYKWFEPETERFDLNLDWFQANLELRIPDGP